MPGPTPPDWWTTEAKLEWWKLEEQYWKLEAQKLQIKKDFYAESLKILSARSSPTAEAADLKSAQSGFESQERDQYQPSLKRSLRLLASAILSAFNRLFHR